MKSRTKKVLLTAAGFTLLGIVCIAVGFLTGAWKHKDQWNLQIGGHRVGIISGDSRVEIKEEYTQEIRELDFEIGMSDVVIRSGNSFSISGKVPQSLQSRITKDGVWKIDMDSVELGIYTGFLSDNNDYKIEITVPREAVFREVCLEIGAGTLQAEGITADEIEIMIGAGEGIFTGVRAGDFSAECGAGEITLSGSISGKADLDCGMGTITLRLQGEPEQFDYEVDCGMGEVRIGDIYQGGGFAAEKEIRNGAGRMMEIDCGMGEIEVDFE